MTKTERVEEPRAPLAALDGIISSDMERPAAVRSDRRIGPFRRKS
jgi:hypothetical protein